MEKLREGTTYILWVLILSFGLLWMLADTQVFDSMMRGPRSAGVVNGEKISLKEYQQRVQYYVQQYNKQNQTAVSAEQRAYLEEQAWNDLVTQRLMEQKMKQMGIQVTNAELVQMITGENPAPIIKRQFQREDGTINRAALRQAIESDKYTRMWIMIEQRLRQKRRQQKMSTYIRSALNASGFEIREEYIRQNSYASFSYVRFPYASIPEDSITVTEQELRAYYNKHAERYKQEQTYQFRYVSFDKTPTKQDTMRTIKELRGLREEFAKAERDSAFLARYQTDAGYQPTQVQKDELRKEFKPLLDLQVGEVTKVIKADEQYHILKKLSKTDNDVTFVRMTYQVEADPIATIEEAHEDADDFSFYSEQSSFQKEASRRNLTIQQTSATKGNDFIPGIGQSRQIMQFLNSADEGTISQPIELSNQFVVIKVTNVEPAGVRPFEQVRTQVRTQLIQKKRENMLMNRASKLRERYSSLEAIAEATPREIETVDQLSLSESVIPGAGREPTVVGAIFGLKNDELSQPVSGSSAIFIVHLKNKDMANPNDLVSSMQQQLAQSIQKKKTSNYMQVWMEELKDNANIVDYRDQILR